MAKINAYQAWLGIPPEQQPPHHYRLLGIELFEADPGVIERGADRQMTYIRSLKLGDQAAVAEKLLNQIAAAKLCLIDPKRKQQYDAQLRQKLVAERPLPTAAPLPATPPNPSPPRQVTVAAQAPALAPTFAAPRTTSTNVRRRQQSNALPLAIGGGVILLLVAAAAIFALSSGLLDKPEVVQAETQLQPDPPPVVETPPNDTISTSAKPTPPVESTPPVSIASAKVELPFATGQIGSGQAVLSDRNYAFGKVAPELEGLAFTQHRYGATGPLTFDATTGGKLYLILPPRKYAEAFTSKIRVPGWATTDLQCEVIVDGKPLSCVVLESEPSPGYTGSIPASPTVWPILAAKALVSTKPAISAVASNLPPTTKVDDEEEPATTEQEDEEEPIDEVGPPATVPSDDRPLLAIDDPDLGGAEKPPATNRPAKTIVRAKLPAATAVALVREKIAEKFGVEQLKEVDDKLSASRALVSMTEDEKTPADERYAAFVVAAELAADAGELTRAMEVLAELEAHFEGDTVDLQLDAVRRFNKAGVPRAAKQQQLASVVPVMEKAISSEKFADVDKVVSELVQARLTSPVLGEQRKRAIALQDKFAKEVEPAMKILETSPNNAEANRIVGNYYAVGLQQWSKALPLLAKGDDPLLARVAKSELAGPQRAEDKLVVAQGWRSAVNERVGPERGPLMLHAEDWYNKAWPDLPERDRQRAREQLGKLQEEMDKLKWPAPPRVVTIFASCGQIFNLAINGKVVMTGIGPEVQTLQTTINAGDIILVQAQRSMPIREGVSAPTVSAPREAANGVGGQPASGVAGGSANRGYSRYSRDPERCKGFACVIAYEGSTRQIVTGNPSSPWKNFRTESVAAWEDPKFVRAFDSVMVGSTTGGQQELIRLSQTNVVSIWGGGSLYECYLFCQVP